ncbi:MAG TPA: LacI family DNA-binding transcriptional regulator [Streptosporangiaceae bacterium]|nr:LacI family DNA-binding transcriptional regulator [Streptosporangiaceae bacterium]
MESSGPGSERPARVTIRQVADLAGVSIATVSRVMNGHADVAESTREAVRRVVREHGYRTSQRARPGASTGLVGVTLPMVHSGYFATILAGISEALYEHDMRVVLCPTRHSLSRETSLLDHLTAGETDGAILVLPEETGQDLQALVDQGFPFVVVDPLTELTEGIQVVCAAHSSGASQVTRHLLELGHQRIGVLAGPRGWLATEERMRGYRAAMAEAALLPDPELIHHSPFRLDGGRDGADRLLALADPPTAIFALNDSMAVGAIQAASARGIGVPADLSIAGFDDTLEAGICVPALTTVRQPLAELGRTAVSVLLRQIENRSFEPLRMELATSLVIRASTAPPRRPPRRH